MSLGEAEMLASSVARDPQMVRGLQERAARALTPRHLKRVGGWWLRHGSGCAWWVATVLAHAEANAQELAARVAAAEDFYAAHGALSRFQISPGVCPAALDAYLAGRGYRYHSPVSLRVAAAWQVHECAPGEGPRVGLAEKPSGAWWRVWRAVHGCGGFCGAEEMLAGVELPSVYASAVIGGDVVAVGRAVAEAGWAGVFAMATLPGARGQGAGRGVLAALAGWARTQGADRLYLQVECDNTAALGLYARAGFAQVCRYHYRSAEPSAIDTSRAEGTYPRAVGRP